MLLEGRPSLAGHARRRAPHEEFRRDHLPWMAPVEPRDTELVAAVGVPRLRVHLLEDRLVVITDGPGDVVVDAAGQLPGHADPRSGHEGVRLSRLDVRDVSVGSVR